MSAFLNSQSQWPMRLCAMTVVLGLSSILGLATPVDLSQSALLVSSEEGDLEQQAAGARAGQVVIAAFVAEGGTTQVIITPPSDRAVDPHILSSIRVASDDGEPPEATDAKYQDTVTDPIDMTGRHVEVIFADDSKVPCKHRIPLRRHIAVLPRTVRELERLGEKARLFPDADRFPGALRLLASPHSS